VTVRNALRASEGDQRQLAGAGARATPDERSDYRHREAEGGGPQAAA
jgi:hypothetical protein